MFFSGVIYVFDCYRPPHPLWLLAQADSKLGDKGLRWWPALPHVRAAQGLTPDKRSQMLSWVNSKIIDRSRQMKCV